MPTEEQDIGLRNLVNLQMHRHTKTCLSTEKICRFNYPRQASEADYVAHTLKSIGFTVAKHIVRIQEGNSCAYNAANVIAKLNAYVEDGIDWFGIDVSDCCYLSDGTNQ